MLYQLKNILFILLLFFYVLISGSDIFAWYSHHYFYSDFQWIDESNILLLRNDNGGGSGEVISDILVLNINDKSVVPVTPYYNGYCVSNSDKKIFFYTNREIVLYDFSKERPVPGPVYSNFSFKPEKIVKVQSSINPYLYIYVKSDYKYKKIYYNYALGKIIKITELDSNRVKQCKSFLKDKIFYSEYKYLIQVAALKNFDNILKQKKQLAKKGYNCFILKSEQQTGTLYKLIIGLYHVKQAAYKFLKKIKITGYSDAFIIKDKFYLINNQKDILFNPHTFWDNNSKNCFLLFDSFYQIIPVSIFNKRMVFLSEGSVFLLDFLQKKVSRLSFAFDYEEEHPPNLYWNRQSKKIIFSRKKGKQIDYWQVNKNGAMLKKIKRGQAMAKPLLPLNRYSSEILEKYAYKYLEKMKRDESLSIPEFIIPGPANKKIIVKFYFYAGSYVTNGVWIHNGNKEYGILPVVTNW